MQQGVDSACTAAEVAQRVDGVCKGADGRMSDDITTRGKTSEMRIDFTVSYSQDSYMPSHLYVCLNDDCDVILISKPVCKCGNTEMHLRKVVNKNDGYDIVYEGK